MPREKSSSEPLARDRNIFVRLSLCGSARGHAQEFPLPFEDRGLRPTNSSVRRWDISTDDGGGAVITKSLKVTASRPRFYSLVLRKPNTPACRRLLPQRVGACC